MEFEIDKLSFAADSLGRDPAAPRVRIELIEQMILFLEIDQAIGISQEILL